MATHFFSYEELRQTDIVEYLEKLGYQPQKITNNDYWYLSPLRDEKEASFKVNRKLNAWFDHGSGKGGNFIDFGVLYYKCSFEQLIEKIENFFSFHPGNVPVQPPLINTQEAKEALEPKIKVIAAKPLTNPILYPRIRLISLITLSSAMLKRTAISLLVIYLSLANITSSTELVISSILFSILLSTSGSNLKFTTHFFVSAYTLLQLYFLKPILNIRGLFTNFGSINCQLLIPG
ncbi:CHC2 zinc finger domain-containing protein [Segetibacter koreensis]|uniref:CHC2 zinc finger domain-containing protein n=1 Tax=Segetibacter koreensis TaxID=398037 RepID=UPI000365D23C|nr:CHC2 zinc finger domain-containing protein [Segetibacter koreensis]